MNADERGLIFYKYRSRVDLPGGCFKNDLVEGYGFSRADKTQ